VQVGRTQAAVDLDLVPQYGYPVVNLAAAVHRKVISMVERMTGLQVLEVNIAVDDTHMPGYDDHDDKRPLRRVQSAIPCRATPPGMWNPLVAGRSPLGVSRRFAAVRSCSCQSGSRLARLSAGRASRA